MPSNRHCEILEKRLSEEYQDAGIHSVGFAFMLLREGWMQQDSTPTQNIARLKGCQEGAGPAYASKTTPNKHDDRLSSGKRPPVPKQHHRFWISFIKERWYKRQMCEFIAREHIAERMNRPSLSGLESFIVVLSGLVFFSVS